MPILQTVRVYGDPVLSQVADELTTIDSSVVDLADEMLAVMYAEPGIGLAATQIGENKRLFVYDVGDGPNVVVNPLIAEGDGEWTYSEGCLSLPGLFWELIRPKSVLLTGWDLQERPVQIEADELLARLFQHEIDHLDGVLLLDHLEVDDRERALQLYRSAASTARPIGAEEDDELNGDQAGG